MTDQPLAGKTALVTGGARNIGRAIAHHLAKQGANIIVNAVSDPIAAAQVVEDIETTGVRAIVCMADITDKSAVDQMFADAADTFGGVDILVLNASSRGQVPFLEMTYRQWRDVIDISLDGAFHCAQAALPMMQQKGWGRIVTLGGISWHIGTNQRIHNLVAKAGLGGFTRGLAVEFAKDGITVNCVSPGFIDTVRPASAGVIPDRDVAAPIARMGSVDEIASMVGYLCSPDSGYITGQIMHVNGGMYLGGS